MVSGSAPLRLGAARRFRHGCREIRRLDVRSGAYSGDHRLPAHAVPDPAVAHVMKQSHIAIIGAPMDLGAGRRGVDMGPSAIRLAGLNEKLTGLGYEVEDLGNVVVDQPESLPVGNPGARYLLQIAHTCTRLAEMVEKAADDRRVPVVLGGDHSVAIGTVSGMSRHLRKAQQ